MPVSVARTADAKLMPMTKGYDEHATYPFVTGCRRNMLQTCRSPRTSALLLWKACVAAQQATPNAKPPCTLYAHATSHTPGQPPVTMPAQRMSMKGPNNGWHTSTYHQH
jgi:hypothetical protein